MPVCQKNQLTDITAFVAGSPRETLWTARSVGLVEDNIWMQMLRVRNSLAHDYDVELAKKYFAVIISEYYKMMTTLKEQVQVYFTDYN